MSIGTLERTQTLELSEVLRRATEAARILKLKLSGVTAVARSDHGWRVTVELIERASIPDTMDLLGVYEIRLDEGGDLVGYERVRLRRRCDLEDRLE